MSAIMEGPQSLRDDATDDYVLVCQRMKTARIMNGMTIEHASARLGYKEGTKAHLSMFETFGETNGKEGKKPPFRVIKLACTVYSVPMDYLVGFIDESEVSTFDLEKYAISRRLESQMSSLVRFLGAQIAQVSVQGSPAVAMSRELVSSLDEFMAVFERFRTRNRDQFEEMLSGNTLLAAAAKLSGAHLNAKCAIERHDNFGMKAMMAAFEQAGLGATLPLFGRQG